MPKSRGGSNNLENICRVSGREHEKYHSLFSNKTPNEILDYLTDVFWKGDDKYIRGYYDEYISGDSGIDGVLSDE
ncbi:MAG: hypothetical protein GY861_28725 [bacterium]|nr:hypothetical protein [bacterium]